MRILGIPCLSKSNARYFDDSRRLKTRPYVDVNVQKPTEVEYAGEAAKEFLKVLEAVAQSIPIPGVGTAVKIATNLIKACEESHATLEKAEELKLRIKMLVTVVVNELKEKKSGEIQEKLRSNIDALHKELMYIEKKLEEIASQHALLLILFRNFNEEKVQKCLTRLDSLLERFTAARHIDHANLLARLEKEVIGFYNSQMQTLEHIHDVVEDINVTMKDVRAMMKNGSPVASAGTRAAIPAIKGLFYGRDVLVSDIVANLTNASGNQGTCILGPGGMGKTATALAVMAHPDLRRHYPDGHRVWVPCVKAISTAIFLDTLASSLGISQITGSIIDSILLVLRSAGPLILLLDNLETPWNAQGERSEIEQILRHIAQFPHITLFVTMRSSAPPCRELPWNSVYLNAIDPTAALQIYSKIHPESANDTAVPALLSVVGHMPLAVTLMATSASLSGLSAQDLIDQYREVGPTMLSQGSDPEHSMDICISLSVDSLPMKRSPDAQWLLAALSMLPEGTTYSVLKTWWTPRLPNISGALQVLRETSLVEVHGNMFSVLPVIQRYNLDPCRFDERVRHSMIASACKFLEKHRSFPGDDSYKEDIAALTTEAGNLEAVLLQTLAPSVEILNALLALGNYQATARPRTNIIHHALELVPDTGDSKLHGAILSCYGSVCHNLDRYEECRQRYAEARELFLSMSDLKEAASCLLACVSAYQCDLSTTAEIMDSLALQAESEFKSVDDIHGIARCWLTRGHTARLIRNYDEALSLLHHAQDTFRELGDALESARCSYSIAMCYFKLEDFEQAKTWSESAVQEFDRVGPSDGSLNALLLLGFIYNALGTHVAALHTLILCLQHSRVSGGPLQAGLALEQMGLAWMQTGKKEDARGAFQEALAVYPTFPGRRDDVQCRYWLKKVEDPSSVPTDEELYILRSVYPPKLLDMYGVAEEETESRTTASCQTDVGSDYPNDNEL